MKLERCVRHVSQLCRSAISMMMSTLYRHLVHAAHSVSSFRSAAMMVFVRGFRSPPMAASHEPFQPTCALFSILPVSCIPITHMLLLVLE